VASVLWVDGACGFKPEACSGSLAASLSHLARELSLQGRACWLVHVVCQVCHAAGETRWLTRMNKCAPETGVVPS